MIETNNEDIEKRKSSNNKVITKARTVLFFCMFRSMTTDVCLHQNDEMFDGMFEMFVDNNA